MTAEPPSPAFPRGYSVTDCVAAALAAAGIAVTGVDMPGWGVVPAIVAASALAWRRVHPGTSAVVATLAVLTAWALPVAGLADGRPTRWLVYVGGALLLATTYSAAAWADRRVAAGALVVAVGAASLAAVLLTGITWSAQLLVSLAAAVLAWTGGQWRRSQRRYLASVQARARLAEAHRERDIALAVASERARIAREMHDVISHSLAVMIAQADGARFVLRRSPDEAAAALTAIADTGRGAVQDMTGLLGALHDDEREDDAGGSASRSPQPRLDDLTTLVAQFGAAGLPTTLTTEGTPVPVSAGCELTVFRVVQEALTNALKHAGRGSSARVRLAWSPAELLVDVTNSAADAPGRERTGGGRGLIGMRERVTHLGGSVHAGRHGDDGYRVHAILPLEPSRVARIPT